MQIKFILGFVKSKRVGSYEAFLIEVNIMLSGLQSLQPRAGLETVIEFTIYISKSYFSTTSLFYFLRLKGHGHYLQASSILT
jgi:hypothetical protein